MVTIMDTMTIAISALIGIMFIIAIIAIFWLKKDRKKERNLREKIVNDSKDRADIFWNELLSHNEGYEEQSVDSNFRKYIVPDKKSTRRVFSVSFTSTDFSFWTGEGDSIKNECFKLNDKIVITKISKSVQPYLIDEIVYIYDKESRQVRRENRVHAYTNAEVIDTTKEYKNKRKDNKKQSKRFCEYHYQLIYVFNNKITPFWYDKRSDAENHMKEMLIEFIKRAQIPDIKNDIDFGASQEFQDGYYELQNTMASLRINEDEHNWLIINLQ